MRNRLKLLAGVIAIGSLAVGGCSSGATGSVETVAPAEAAAIITSEADEVVLDIRTAEEFSGGIIEGAVNIDYYATDFASQLDELDKDAHYVVYCRSGNRSGEAQATFVDLGFMDVSEIEGGIANWYNSGLPIVVP